MKNYKAEILGRLIDKYEKSKSFIGANLVNQSFSIQLEKEFTEYADDSNVEAIHSIDDAVLELQKIDLARGKRRKNGVLFAVELNPQKLEECYKHLRRTPKKETNNALIELLTLYENSNDIIGVFCREQKERLSANKKPEHFTGDIDEYRDLLKCLSAVTTVSQETYQRDFSIKEFGDSKRFEKLRSSICSILFEYGDFPDKDTILEDLNIVKNPGHVYFKGAGTIDLDGQIIDLSILDGDIAISSSMLKNIKQITVSGHSVLTIENLTTFNTYKPKCEFVIYLGGYHNSVRREFIKQIYEQNPSVKYYHYGDIDAGGFYILLHLRSKTGVHFEPFKMDVETLSNNIDYSKKLTENDEKRLLKLKGGEFDEVIEYMLKNHCKLEQEALD